MAGEPTSEPRVVPAFRVMTTTTSRGQVVRLDGHVDVRTAADLRLALHTAIASGDGDLYVHLDGVEIGDATGLGVLVEAHRRARREGRRLVLADITPRTARLLRLSRLDRVMHVGVGADDGAMAPLTA